LEVAAARGRAGTLALVGLVLTGGGVGACGDDARTRPGEGRRAAAALSSVGDEIALGEPPLGRLVGHQRRPRIAASPDGYLLVWLQFPSHALVAPVIGDLYAARLDRSGALLDPWGLKIADSVPDAAVTWDGSHYLVAYADIEDRRELRSDLRYYHYDVWGVFARRVATDGSFLEPIDGPIVLADFSRDIERMEVAVAASGSRSLVAWVDDDRKDGSDHRDLHAQQLDAAGARAGNTVSLAGAPGLKRAPAVASDGDGFLVAWADGRDNPGAAPTDVYATAVSAAGAIQVPGGALVSVGSSPREGVSLAWNGGHYLATWRERDAAAGDGIAGRRIGPDGSVADATDLAIAPGLPDRRQHPAGSLARGDGFLVAWTSFDIAPAVGNLRIAGIGGDGAVADPGGRVLAPVVADGGNALLAPGTPSNLVAWDDTGALPTFDVLLAPLDVAAVLSAPANPVTLSPISQTHPALASDGSELLAVWGDTRDGVINRIYGARVGAGVVKDPGGFPIGPARGLQQAPVVAWGGGTYLVVWRETAALGGTGSLYAARVGADGRVADPQGVLLARPESPLDPAVAWAGDAFLVVWRTSTSRAATVRVKADGTILDASPRLLAGIRPDQASPSIAGGPQGWLLAWAEDVAPMQTTIRGARLGLDGALLDCTNLPIGGSGIAQHGPVAVWGGGQYFVAWNDQRRGQPDVFGTRVSAGGAVLDPGGIAISAAEQAQYSPALVWDGGSYLVTWDDLRGGTFLADVFGARIGVDGTVLDPEGFAVSMDPAGDGPSAVGSPGDGRALVLYQRRDDGGGRQPPPPLVFHLRGRQLAAPPPGALPEPEEGVAPVCPPDAGASDRPVPPPPRLDALASDGSAPERDSGAADAGDGVAEPSGSMPPASAGCVCQSGGGRRPPTGELVLLLAVLTGAVMLRGHQRGKLRTKVARPSRRMEPVRTAACGCCWPSQTSASGRSRAVSVTSTALPG
jgi:hypothetical protein